MNQGSLTCGTRAWNKIGYPNVWQTYALNGLFRVIDYEKHRFILKESTMMIIDFYSRITHCLK